MTADAFRIAVVMLVDAHGRILLQLRDGNTRIDPHRWCLLGGAVEPGEDAVTAALRELFEETGLTPDTELILAWRGRVPSERFPSAVADCHVFLGRTAARQEDVQCNEGDAMVFTPVNRLPALEFGRAHRQIVPAVLASPLFAALGRPTSQELTAAPSTRTMLDSARAAVKRGRKLCQPAWRMQIRVLKAPRLYVTLAPCCRVIRRARREMSGVGSRPARLVARPPRLTTTFPFRGQDSTWGSPNYLLRRARLRFASPSGSGRPLSRQELTEAVNAYLFNAMGRSTSLDGNYVGRLERGAHRWPRAHHRVGFRRVLGAGNDAELGFYNGRVNPADEVPTPEELDEVAGPGQSLAVFAPPVALPATSAVQLTLSLDSAVTVRYEDPARVAIIAGPVRLLIEAPGIDVSGIAAPTVADGSVPGGARLYSISRGKGR